jgi:hypothetical protein
MAKKFLKRKIIRVALGLLVCFILMQFIRPSLDNPPVTEDLQAPSEVKSILQRACYDCHSNETKLAWFDKPAPAYWLVTEHVKEGRTLLNFSHWDSLTADQRKAKLFESLNQMMFGEMPLSQYTTFHGNAQLSGDDIKVMRKYLASLSPPKLADSIAVRAADDQYVKWTKGNGSPSKVKPELNGLAFMPDYRDWSPISCTERWDNGTMRVIMGNPVAVKAVNEGHTNPWPDGSAFAKVDWKQLLRPSGEIEPGEFVQVELMVKDKDRYSATDGWGWGRWKGEQLRPYGKDAAFVTECMHCHQPMKERDFVFTMPINWGGLPGWKVVTSKIDKSQGLMSILYGNDTAVNSARNGGEYPAGAQFAEVTWKLKEDEHWYGANVPDHLVGMDKLRYDTIQYIAVHRASVMP